METTQQKLDHLVSLGEQLNDWDRGFVESVADQYKQRNLSYGQIEVVNKILAKHSPEQIKARNAWRASYMRKNKYRDWRLNTTPRTSLPQLPPIKFHDPHIPTECFSSR